MKTTFALGMILTLSLALAGCSNKDAEFKAFTADFEKVTGDMVAKIDADPTEQGVAEAQKVLDAKKADLKAKWAAIKDARGIQVSQDVQKSFEEAMKRSAEKATGVIGKLDLGAAEKYQKLMEDWGSIVQGIQ